MISIVRQLLTAPTATCILLKNKMFLATVTRMHEFLKSLGYVKGKPTVDKHLKRLAKQK